MAYADSNGVKIWWEELGEGAPVLLLMGFGNSGHLWRPVAERLAAKHRVLVVDNRGTGQSDSPKGPYTVPEMAADAVAVLDAAGTDKAAVYGVSLGGAIAQEVAIAYPARVSSLVLGCTACPEHLVGGSRVGLSLLLLGRLLPKRLAARLTRPYAYDAGTTEEQLAAIAPIREAAAAPTRTLWLQSRAGLFETCSRVAAIQAPTLVLHGTSDRLIPIDNGRRLAQQIAGAKFVEIPNSGHMFMLEQPDTSTTEVLKHLGG
jgi:pimeloyl-ACP methyl ester carboxylesterase